MKDRWKGDRSEMIKLTKRKRGGVYKKCEACKKEFYSHPYEVKRKRFCSTNCANKANREQNSKSKRGKKNPMYGKRAWNYIDGSRVGRKRDWKYINWQKGVLKRDNYGCQICTSKLDLIAHHKKSWRRYLKFRYRISNGITLCRKCHGKIESKIIKNEINKKYNSKTK
jgi:5-methylcytosine-specific restriction endonuclease McrA